MSRSPRYAFLVAFLMMTSCMQDPTHRISREQLQEMFDGMAQQSGWDMSGDMVWGYFFTNASRAPLERAAEALAAEGYTFVDIYLSDKESTDEPDVWWLHVEKVETHSVGSLDARNDLLYEFADQYGLDTYDGMDVGPIGKPN